METIDDGKEVKKKHYMLDKDKKETKQLEWRNENQIDLNPCKNTFLLSFLELYYKSILDYYKD